MNKHLFLAILLTVGVSCEKVMDDGTVLGWREYYVPTTVFIDGVEYSCKKISDPFFRSAEWSLQSESTKFYIHFIRQLRNHSDQGVRLITNMMLPRPLICGKKYDLSECSMSSFKITTTKTDYKSISGWLRIDDIAFVDNSYSSEYSNPTLQISFEALLSNGVDTLILTNGKTQGNFFRPLRKNDPYEVIIDGKYHDFWPEEYVRP